MTHLPTRSPRSVRLGAPMVLSALLFAAPGCGTGDGIEGRPVVRPERRVVVESLLFAGRIEPLSRKPVKSPFDSTLLTRIPHGTRVSAGQVVGTVDATPHQRELEVLEADRDRAAGELELARLEAAEEEFRAARDLEKASRRLSRAKVALDALLRGRDLTGILRLERSLALGRKTLERVRDELARQRPFVEKGFVSAAEIQDMEARIVQLELTTRREEQDLAALRKGPPEERVAERQFDLAVAREELGRTRVAVASQVQIARAKVERAVKLVEEVDEQVADRRRRILECAMVAPVAGTFLESTEEVWGLKAVVGSRAWAMLPVGWVAEGGDCEVVFAVGETHLGLVTLGRRIRFLPVADRRRWFPGEIREVSRVARFDPEDPVGVRWMEVRARILVPPSEYGAVRPGLNAEVELGGEGGEPVLALPAACLLGGGVLGPDGAWRPVEVGRTGAAGVPLALPGGAQPAAGEALAAEPQAHTGLAWAEIVSGLLPGELVLSETGDSRPTRVEAAVRGTVVETYEESGTLTTERPELLYNNAAEEWRTKVTWMIEEGSEVEPGTVCVKLDPGELANSLEVVEEELRMAQAELGKVEASAGSDADARRAEIQVAASRLRFLEANRALVAAGRPDQEKAKLAANLAALEVDEKALSQKLEVTRKMEGQGFAGARETAELEEKWEKARADVEVARLELELARAGSTESEVFLAKVDVEDARSDLHGLEEGLARQAERSRVQVAAVKSKVLTKEREIARRKAQLEGFELKASRAGVVVYQKHRLDTGELAPFEPGSFARRGEAIVAVADLARARVEGLVSEEVAWRVEPGLPARFWQPAFPEEKFPAKVVAKGNLPEELPDSGGEQGLRVELEVLEQGPRLQPGMQVRFELELARLENRVLVPIDAVEDHDGETLVRMADGTRRRVVVAGRDSGRVALESGIEEGERVVVP